MQRLALGHSFDDPPDQIIVNEYEPGQGIALHADRSDCFGPVVATLSLVDSWPMDFRETESGEHRTCRLDRRSLLVLRDATRHRWQHGVSRRRSDPGGSNRKPRRRRVSVTFRTVRFALPE